MIRTFIDFLFRPRFDNYSGLNLAFYCVSLCLGAFIGSAVSVFVIAGSIYATLHLATGRLKWALPRPVEFVFFAFIGLFMADLVAALIHPSRVALQEVFENLPFLGFAGLYSITFVDRARLLAAVETVAAAASILAIPVILVLSGHQYRPEMASGNSSVLAVLAGILYLITIGAADRRWNRSSLVFLIAAACAAYITVLSGTRAMWLALILIPIYSLLFHHPWKRILIGLPILVMLFAGLTGLLSAYSEIFEMRIGQVVSESRSIMTGDLSGPMGQRIRIYQAGYELMLEKPVFGYGPGNERQEIAQKTLELSGVSISYSHAHNAALTAMLRSGLLGVMALAAVVLVPLVVAYRARKDEVGAAGFFLLSGLMIVYLCSGLVGLMLGHDIHDSVFIAGVCFSLYLVFDRAEAPESRQT
ncbi:hypothetical protein LL06_05945 [Hoeflea sp. BAL378]|uniref:O-antigen ligase family protein n=1 Tax=Hoeflea sp. BAL378 TaxID=1547437 RepID=UPI000513A4FD|nr:O-antigen ligase family protein [Hoeflea sp. BAL378]KGF70314.1 hypothetical protein LL06_05945 [Hoeflea sp. BAL378]